MGGRPSVSVTAHGVNRFWLIALVRLRGVGRPADERRDDTDAKHAARHQNKSALHGGALSGDPVGDPPSEGSRAGEGCEENRDCYGRVHPVVDLQAVERQESERLTVEKDPSVPEKRPARSIQENADKQQNGLDPADDPAHSRMNAAPAHP